VTTACEPKHRKPVRHRLGLDTYQDELIEDWMPPDDEEKDYIETVIKPRLSDQ
jgi:hypothetical protein